MALLDAVLVDKFICVHIFKHYACVVRYAATVLHHFLLPVYDSSLYLEKLFLAVQKLYKDFIQKYYIIGKLGT